MVFALNRGDDGDGERYGTADRDDGPWWPATGPAEAFRGSCMTERSRTSGRWAALSGWEDLRRATAWAAAVVVDSLDLLAQGVTAVAVGAGRGRRHPAPLRLVRAA
jgi:hypothetical protein